MKVFKKPKYPVQFETRPSYIECFEEENGWWRIVRYNPETDSYDNVKRVHKNELIKDYITHDGFFCEGCEKFLNYEYILQNEDYCCTEDGNFCKECVKEMEKEYYE